MNGTTRKTEDRDDHLDKIVSALRNGLVLLDASGRIVWADEKARRNLNGGLEALAPTQHSSLTCTLSTIEIPSDGHPKSICLLQATADQKEVGSDGHDKTFGNDLIAALEAVMSDTSWFTRTIVEKLRAWRQANQPSTSAADLDILTDREREILALICEGRSDAEMSELLGLSQNTVRNHVASLYRKIGVNRRSAAIIWARERAITSYEVRISKRPRRVEPENRQNKKQHNSTSP